MSNYYYFDVHLKLRETKLVVITPAYFRGCILNSLESFFGEIGGKTTLEIIRFSVPERRAVFRVPEEFYERTRTAISLIGYYQEVPCHFKVLETSKTPLDFDKGYSEVFGKDKVIFATKEDHSVPSTIELPEPEPPQGLIMRDGGINWSCPCLGGMATGPCGVQFRQAFTCFHESKADPKGSDCYEAFRTMQDCFQKYPTVYNKSNGDDDDDGLGDVMSGDNDTNIQDVDELSGGAGAAAAAQMRAKNNSALSKAD